MVEYQAAKPSSPKPQQGTYYIRPPDGGEPEKYQRMTKFIDVFSDKTNLQKRDIRFAVKGSAKYAEQLAGLDIDEHRYEIDNIADKAAREAGKWWSADYGTAMHALTEDYDNGLLKPDFKQLPESPAVMDLARGPKKVLTEYLDSMRNDLQGYALLVEAYEIETVHAELTLVIDNYKVAGTGDRFVRINNPMDLPVDDSAETYALDLKTGSVDFGRREKAMQLAGYAKAKAYNHDTGDRFETGASQKYGLILHLPAGKGAGSIIPVKLERAAQHLEKAFENWEIRKTKEMWKKHGLDDWIADKITAAETDPELREFYFSSKAYWTPEHVAMAKRKEFTK